MDTAIAVPQPDESSLGELEELRGQLHGRLLLPGDADYDTERRLYNAMFDSRPAVLAQCEGAADVAAAARFARDRSWPICVRGGGHAAEGGSMVDGAFAIDLSRMNGVRVTPRSRVATVQAGARWRIVDREAQFHGLATTGGTVSDTGVAGLTLGGGLGWLMRKYGATVDNLIGLDAVTLGGESIRISEDENADLFWGMRGAGGNFGIVTSFDFRLHEVGPIVLGGSIYHSEDRAVDALRFFREYMDDAPDEVMAIAFLSRGYTHPNTPAELHGDRTMVRIMVVHVGNPDDAAEVLRPLREWGPPVLETIRPTPYVEVQQAIECYLPVPIRVYEKGGYLPALTDGAIEAALGAMADAPVSHPERPDLQSGFNVAIWRLGGKLDRVPNDATAFSRENGAYMFGMLSLWAEPALDDQWITCTRNGYARIAPHMTEHAYLNLTMDSDDARIREAYGSEKYDRLVRLKDRWDPENLLRFGKNIPPSGWTAARA